MTKLTRQSVVSFYRAQRKARDIARAEHAKLLNMKERLSKAADLFADGGAQTDLENVNYAIGKLTKAIEALNLVV